MSIEGYLLLLLILAGLYWLGYKINPPIGKGHPIVPEPNGMVIQYSRGYAPVRGEEE